MYIPSANEETDLPTLHRLIEAHPLATLVTYGATGLFASHLPVMLDRTSGPSGMLKAHLSRANTQWRDFDPGIEALAIFAGPEHYISPSWYKEKQTTGKVVPTWNYVTVHAYVRMRVIDDVAWLANQVSALTDRHEAASPEPWQVSDAPAAYIESLLKGIVGLELEIIRIEGKWKLSQNQKEQDRLGVVAGLDALSTPSSNAMKTQVLEALQKPRK